jgi:hypothetical protein
MIARRKFIATLAGAAVAPVLWPLAARAQQQGVPLVGILRSTPNANFSHLSPPCVTA